MCALSYLYQSTPMEWETFERFMDEMSEHLADPACDQRKKLASLQTLIALGAYLGLPALELLSTQWHQVKNVDVYSFVHEKHRRPSPIEERLAKIINTNYDIIEPASNYEYILRDNILSRRPCMPRKFNNMLTGVFDQFGLAVTMPNANLLRRTFARRLYIASDGSEAIVNTLAEELRISTGSVKKYVDV